MKQPIMLTTVPSIDTPSDESAFRKAISRGHELSPKAALSAHVSYADFLAKEGNFARAWMTLWAATCFGKPSIALVDGLERQLERLINHIANGDCASTAPGYFNRLFLHSTLREDTAAWMKSAKEALRQGDLIVAAVCLWRVEQLNPSNGVRLSISFLKARILDESGLSVAALRTYVSLIGDEHFSLMAMPHIESIVVAAPSKAVLAMVSKLAATHTDVEGLKALKAFCEVHAGHAPTDMKALERAAEDRSNVSWLWSALARAYGGQGERGRELASLQKAAACTPPRDEQGLLAIAKALDGLGAEDAATQVLIKALSGDPGVDVTSAFIRRARQGAKKAGKRSGTAPPLILVSQIQRSGGTLLSRLFDGHPELLAHPHEIQIGRPQKWHWPNLDLSLPREDWLRDILEPRLAKFVVLGYSKADGNIAATEKLPFNLDLLHLCSRFLEIADDMPRPTQRAVIDAYLTAYFDAWGDYHRSGREKWTCGFIPRLISNYGSVRRYVSDYPDGLLISCIRNPIDWFVSARRHDPEYSDIGHAIELWKTSTLAALYLQEEDPGHIYLLTYESLVTAPEAEIGLLAGRLGISFSEELLTPTYLGTPMLPNSSFRVDKTGISTQSVNMRHHLSDDEAALIALDAMPLYRAACEAIAERRRA